MNSDDPTKVTPSLNQPDIPAEDIAAPNLKSFSVDNYDIDVSQGSVYLESTIQITDDLSGFDWGQIYWESPSGEQQLFGGNIQDYAITSGDSNNGIYTITSDELSQHSENGEWSIRDGFLQDKVGNTFHFNDKILNELGHKTTLNISGGLQDSFAPELKSFSIDNYDIDVSQGSVYLESTIQITDDLSGFDWGQIYWESPSGEQQLFGGNIQDYAITSGDSNNGIYTITSDELSQHSENGEWSIRDGFLQDKVGNTFHFNDKILNELGHKTTLNISGGLQDSFAPELKSFSIDNYDIDVSQGSVYLESTIQITDDLSGFDWGQIYWESPSGEQQLFGGNIQDYAITSGDSNNGIYTITSDELSQHSENGEWSIRDGFLQDKVGNTFRFNDADLEALGIKSTFNVFSNTKQQSSDINIDFEDDFEYFAAAGTEAEFVLSKGFKIQTILEKGWNDIEVSDGSLIHWGGWKKQDESQPELRVSGEASPFQLKSLDIANTDFSPEYIIVYGFKNGEATPFIEETIELDTQSDAKYFQTYTLSDNFSSSSLHYFELEGGVYYDDITQGDFLLDNITLSPTNVLDINYSLLGIDEAFLGLPVPLPKEVKKQIAVLGDSVDHNARYDLNITADILNDYMIEGADITIGFDTQLFNSINASNVTIGTELPIANAVQIDNELGTIRLAAATLSQLTQNGDDISSDTVLASISLDFDEAALATIEKNTDGSLKTNPLAFTIDANLDETVFSKLRDDGSGFNNRDIQSLRDLGGTISVDGQDVTLYEAKINLEQQGDGLVLGTQRVIGADAEFTNLIRKGDTLSTSATWLNVGNATANNIEVQSLSNANASLAGSTLSKTSLNSGSFIDGAFVQDGREDLILSADIHITGDAGNVLDLADGILSIKAEGSEVFTNTSAGSSNLITFQGDLNYDGRVSMKDLAYLNAGAARQQMSVVDVIPDPGDRDGNGILDASVARDVDADFSGKIDIKDLSILDQDWGKSLHIGGDSFQGSADVSWSELDNQGENSTWDNSSFKEQNAIESDAAYIRSLEPPISTGVIGANGNTSTNDDDIQGTEGQDSFAA